MRNSEHGECRTEQSNDASAALHDASDNFVLFFWIQRLQTRIVNTAERKMVRRDPKVGSDIARQGRYAEQRSKSVEEMHDGLKSLGNHRWLLKTSRRPWYMSITMSSGHV